MAHAETAPGYPLQVLIPLCVIGGLSATIPCALTIYSFLFNSAFSCLGSFANIRVSCAANGLELAIICVEVVGFWLLLVLIVFRFNFIGK